MRRTASDRTSEADTPITPGHRRIIAPLRRGWERWKRIARAIGQFQARIILTLFYFVVVPPFALVLRLTKDPLGLTPPTGDSFWSARSDDASSRAGTQQF